MAKKKKATMAAHDRIALHRSITEQIPRLIARCGRLRDQGRMDEARQLLARIERLTIELSELEKL